MKLYAVIIFLACVTGLSAQPVVHEEVLRKIYTNFVEDDQAFAEAHAEWQKTESIVRWLKANPLGGTVNGGKVNPNDVAPLLAKYRAIKEGLEKRLWDQVFKRYQELLVSVRTPAPVVSSTGTSRVDGTWEGWEGDTVVKLIDGSIWRQLDYQYEYSYKMMPSVTIVRDGLRYKMLIDGSKKLVTVEQLY